MRADINAFSVMPEKPTVRAWVAELDGRIVGIGGIAREQGRWFAFIDLEDEARPYKVHIARSARRFLDQARRDGIRFIYAEVNHTDPRALLWLFSLGFEFDERSKHFHRWTAVPG